MARRGECVGCGYCCKKVICWAGMKANKRMVRAQGNNRGPCPSLIFRDNRYWCELVIEATGKKLDALCDDLSIGAGCCCGLNSDRLAILKQQASK